MLLNKILSKFLYILNLRVTFDKKIFTLSNISFIDMQNESDLMQKIPEVYRLEKEREAQLLAENEKLKALYAMQTELIQNQRELLKQVGQETKRLIEIEKEKAIIDEQIKEEVKDLETIVGDSENVIKIINENAIGDETQKITTIDAMQKVNLLKGIETIQAMLFNISEQAMKEKRTTIPKLEIQKLIVSVNEIINIAVETGAAKESIDQTIARHSLVIDSLHGIKIPE